MGLSKKSHGKKEHKETQSPVLKIFKDFRDPEKANLLKEKVKEKKRKTYCGFRKTDQKTYDSSSTDKQTRQKTINNVNEEKELQCGGVREAWWAQAGKDKFSDDTTCSCVSCALKKVLASEYACVACLLVLFSVTVVGAFCFVFKSSPAVEPTKAGHGVKTGDGGKKLQVMKRQLGDENRSWDTVKGYYGLFGSDFADTREQMNTLDDGVSNDLASVLGRERISESPNSDRLREFYKKLIETDAQIKKLKESTILNYQGDVNTAYDRFKRSYKPNAIKFKPNQDTTVKDETSLGQEVNGDVKSKNRDFRQARDKRRVKKNAKPDNDTEPAGVFLKEKKIVVKYGPIQRQNFPKCHRPHEETHHERKLKHPFYKISQRFDEMLNKYVKTEKPSGETSIVKHSTEKNVFRYPDTHATTFDDNTILYDRYTKDVKYSKNRKLLQVDEEEDLGFEDLKEVLADDDQPHDELDPPLERVKRNDDSSINSPNLYNMNWKGSYLYPEELHAMVQQAAIQNLQFDTKDGTHILKSKESDGRESDREYLEHYIDSKYDKLVGLSQAYSDYGVFEGKEKSTEKPPALRFFDRILVKKGVFGRTKKDLATPSEGLRIEYRPDPYDSSLRKLIGKHLKIIKPLRPCHSKISTPPEISVHLFTEKENHITETTPLQTKEIDRHMITEIKTSVKDKTHEKSFKTRSLQSVDLNTKEENSDASIKEGGYNKEEVIGEDNFKEIDIVNVKDKENQSIHSFELGDFASMMADWFFKMADVSGELDKAKNRSKPLNKNDVIYPMYDSEMVDNIGHRSRMLMSLGNVTANLTQMTDSTVNNTTNKTTVIPKSTNKTQIKRSVENFIFWNDIYDEDEYGAKLDYFDVTRAKHADKGMLLKSKDWLKDKVKMASDKIKVDFERTVNSFNKMPSKTKPKQMRSRSVRNVNSNPEDDDVASSFAALNANLKRVCRDALDAVRKTRRVEVREDDGFQATGLMQKLVQLMGDLVNIQVQQRTCAKLPADLRGFLEWLVAPAENQPYVDNLSPSAYHRFPDEGYYEGTPDPYQLPFIEDTHDGDRTDCLGTIRAVQDLIQQYEGMSYEDKSKMDGVREYLENQLNYLNRKLNTINESMVVSSRKREARNKRNVMYPRYRRLFNKYLTNFDRKHTKTTPHTKMTRARVDKFKNEINDRKGEVVKITKNCFNDINDFNDHLANGKSNDNFNNDNFNNDNSNNDNSNNDNSNNDNSNNDNSNNVNSNNDNSNNDNSNNDNSNNDNSNNDNIINDRTMKRNLKDVYFRALNEAKKSTPKKI